MDQLSLLELNETVKKVLKNGLAPSYWVIAEISEIRLNPRGHCYLELVQKDEHQIIAKAKATIWSSTYSNLSLWFQKMTGLELKEGMKILFNASVQYHEIFGLSLNIKDIDANYTIGERAIKRQKVINQLEEDGVLKMNKEIELPIVPQRIAIISSETAAGYGDFIDQLNTNSEGYSFHTCLFQATMQGDTAAQSMIQALLNIHDTVESFDIVAIIRGGGSQLDLDCFDDYELNFHLAQFPKPVLTGIGHDRDETIADIVAHLSLKTPTALAAFLIEGIRTFEVSMDSAFTQIVNSAHEHLITSKHLLYQNALLLSRYTNNYVNANVNNLLILEQKLGYSTKHVLQKEGNRLENLNERLHLLLPETIFKRGYSLTSINNKIIGRQSIKPGDIINTETQRYYISSEIKTVKDK